MLRAPHAKIPLLLVHLLLNTIATPGLFHPLFGVQRWEFNHFRQKPQPGETTDPHR